MAESSGEVEFLLGIEEYLKYLNYDRMSQTVHSLSRVINLSNPEEETIKIFLQDFGGDISNIDLADLMHRAVKAEILKDFQESLLHYLGKAVVINQDIKDFIFAALKVNSSVELKNEALKYIGKNVDNIDTKDFIFALTKASSNDEFVFKVLLQYVGKVSDLAESEKDLIFSLIKSTGNELSYKALLKYIGNLAQVEKDEKDLIFGVTKSKDFYSLFRVVLHYLGKKVSNQEQKDLIYSILKSTNKEGCLKSLLQYLGKVEQGVNSWLAFEIKKDESLVNRYQILLDLIPKVENLNVEILDIIHGYKKSETRLDYYKSLLHFLGKVTQEDYNSMASLSMAIARVANSSNYKDDFIKSYLSMLDRQFLQDKIFRGINTYIKSDYDRDVLNDAFSRSQIKSKIWLVEELSKISKHFSNVAIFGGWFGQLRTIYSSKMTYAKVRNVELDKLACEISDYVFNLSNLEDYKVKSVNANINELVLHQNGYEWAVENFRDGSKFTEKFLPNLIVNTSAEHMTEEWFHQIRFKILETTPIVAIQSNNLFEINEHVNCVHSIDHLKKKFPMKEILYEGELQLKGYKRVMLIGTP